MFFLAYIGDIAEGPGGRSGGDRLGRGGQGEKNSRISNPLKVSAMMMMMIVSGYSKDDVIKKWCLWRVLGDDPC